MKVLKYSLYFLICWGFLARVEAQKAKAKPATKPISLKVMTFNIHHGENNMGKTNLARIVELMREHQPDFVALQEIDSVVPRSGQLNQMRILSLLSDYHSAFSDAIDLQGGKYGLGILSNWTYPSTPFKIIEYKVLDELTASDHLPLLVTYSFDK